MKNYGKYGSFFDFEFLFELFFFEKVNFSEVFMTFLFWAKKKQGNLKKQVSDVRGSRFTKHKKKYFSILWKIHVFEGFQGFFLFRVNFKRLYFSSLIWADMSWLLESWMSFSWNPAEFQPAAGYSKFCWVYAEIRLKSSWVSACSWLLGSRLSFSWNPAVIQLSFSLQLTARKSAEFQLKSSWVSASS